MNILTINQLESEIRKLRNKNKKIVLVGGCFDLLHIGHITFLEKAKRRGDILIVLLESDQSVRKMKGENRPINNIKDRAKVLSSLKFVDFVIMLSQMSDKDYDQLVEKIKPDVIATAKRDKGLFHKLRQAEKVGAKVKVVTAIVKDSSTTNLIKLLG